MKVHVTSLENETSPIDVKSERLPIEDPQAVQNLLAEALMTALPF
jgi:hypothetical protein